MKPAEVGNAGDPKQVRRAEQRVRSRQKRFARALRAVLETPEGRLLFGERQLGVLARCGTFRTVFADNPVRMAYNAGRQDVGHELMALLTGAGEELFLRMEAECRALEARDAVETAAANQETTETT